MSFAIFRKYQKPHHVGGTVVFSVLIFATFSGFGSLKNLLSQHATVECLRQFDVHSSGQRHVTSHGGVHGGAPGAQPLLPTRRPHSGDEGTRTSGRTWIRLGGGPRRRPAGHGPRRGRVRAPAAGGQPARRSVHAAGRRDRCRLPSGPASARGLIHDSILGGRWLADFDSQAAASSTPTTSTCAGARTTSADYDAVVVADLTDEQIPRAVHRGAAEALGRHG